jgi:hypothetical protein
MELIDKGFAQKIADRYSNLNLFSINFAPIISTKRFIPRMKWLELVYALPYLVLRREILNSFKRTKNVLTSVKRIWNIFVRFEFPLSRYEYITTRSHRFSREIMKTRDPGSKIPVKHLADIMYPVSSPYVNHVKSRGFYFAYPYSQLKPSSMELAQPVSREPSGIETEKEPAVKNTNYQLPVVTHQPPVVSHRPPAVCYEDQATYILTNTSDFITPLFSYYPFKPTFFLRQKTGQVKQRKVPLNLQKSDAVYRPYAHIEKETLLNGQKISSQLKQSSMELVPPVSRETTGLETEKESAFANYQLPVVTHQPPVVSHKPLGVSNKNLDTYILPSRSDLITPLFSYYSAQKIKTDMGEKAIYDILPYFNFRNNKQMYTSEVEKAPIYHIYPEIEHITSTHTEVMKERVIEKEEESEPPHVTPQLPGIDVNRLADQVYSVIERKVRIERERRGL